MSGATTQAQGTQPEANGEQTPANRWAVTQTGYISSDGEPTVFMDDNGTRLPQVIRVCDDEATARKLLKRQDAIVGRLNGFNLKNTARSRPIYGIAEVFGPAKKPRKEMTPEQKKLSAERLAAGRKRAKQTSK